MTDTRANRNRMRPDRLSKSQKVIGCVMVGLSLFAAMFAAVAMSTVSDSALWIYGMFCAVGLVGLGLSWVLLRVQSPPVRCCACNARGWLEDLTPEDAHCPVCGGDSFVYMRPGSTQPRREIRPIHTEALSGKALLERAKGKFWD